MQAGPAEGRLQKMRKRFLKVFKTASILTGIGALYFIFVSVTDVYVPCLFYKSTGLYCPGCGVSRMFVHMIEFDFYGAFKSNECAFILFPLFVFYIGFKIFKYIKSGLFSYTKTETAFIWIITAILILFGILRNIPYFSYLAPT